MRGTFLYATVEFQINSINFNDTFLSFDHLRKSFPRHDVNSAKPDPIPPFRVTFEESEKPTLTVESVVRLNRGPYPFNAPKKNNILFTPTQVEAIRSGINPGLTLIVGPPGQFALSMKLSRLAIVATILD